jgi:solute carrier family 39 (zinc transporter), member 13
MNSTLDTLALFEIYLPESLKSITYVPWVFSLLGSLLIGLSGILPMIIIPTDSGEKGKDIKNRK